MDENMTCNPTCHEMDKDSWSLRFCGEPTSKGCQHINRCLQHFTLKLQKIFHFLQEKFKKISFVLLFHFTFCVYF
jgi:hypothetical protein